MDAWGQGRKKWHTEQVLEENLNIYSNYSYALNKMIKTYCFASSSR